MANVRRRSAAAYVSWATFKDAIRSLALNPPNRVDETVFPELSESTRMQLIPALKFFGLVDSDRTPTNALKSLPSESPQLSATFRQLFESSYAELLEIDLTKATPSELREALSRSYNLSGNTTQKALRFFLAAAKELELSLSGYLFTNVTKASVKRSYKRRTTFSRVDSLASIPPMSEFHPQGIKELRLRSGGTIILSGTLDPFSLSPADRAFVDALFARFESYETGT